MHYPCPMRLLPFLLLAGFLCAPLLAGCSGNNEESPPGLPHGEFTIPTDAPWFDSTEKPGARFEFSTGQWVFEPNDPKDGDIAFYSTFLVGSGKTGVAIQDTQPESINYTKFAPDSGYEETKDPDKDLKMPIYSSHVYWIKCHDGKYAKIKIESAELNAKGAGYDRLVVRWVYQPDGSRDFNGKKSLNPGDGATNGTGRAEGLGAAHGLDESGGDLGSVGQ